MGRVSGPGRWGGLASGFPGAWRHPTGGVPRLLPPALAIAAGVAASLVVAAVIHPLGPTTIDPDAAASVLYFERITSGQRLEAFVPTTPKPLLTLLYGLTWGFVRDWRVLTWETLVAFGVAVSLAIAWASRIGRRVAGRPTVGVAGGLGGAGLAAVVAASFLAVGLVASSDLTLEVSRANSLVWALVAWLVAALALSGPRARPGLAGVALLAGGLVRFETLAIVAAAAVVLVVRAAVARSGRGDAPDAGSWLVLLGLLAVPIACLHDALLTGDPFYWAGVAARYTEIYAPSAAAAGPLDVARTLAARLAAEWGIAALAAVGLAGLLRRRAWSVAIGLGGLGAGIVLLLFTLAARGTYVSARYYEPLDLALLALAACGAAALAGAAASWRWRRRFAGSKGSDGSAACAGADARSFTAEAFTAAAFTAGVAAVILAWPAAPFDRSVASSLDLVRVASANLAAYGGRLGGLAGGPAAAPSPGPVGAPSADPARVTLFVPSLLRTRLAVETGVPLTALGDTYASYLTGPAWAGLHAGQRLYHDRAADRPDALDRALEADPARLGEAVATAALVDLPAGVRILTVDSP